VGFVTDAAVADDLHTAVNVPYASVLLRLVTGEAECARRVTEQLQSIIAPVRVVALVALLIGNGLVNDGALGLRVAVAAQLGFGDNQPVGVLLQIGYDMARLTLLLGRRTVEDPTGHFLGVALSGHARFNRAGRPLDRGERLQEWTERFVDRNDRFLNGTDGLLDWTRRLLHGRLHRGRQTRQQPQENHTRNVATVHQ